MFLEQIFDPSLAQYAYLIGCQRTGEAIIIDPERDIDRYIDLAAQHDFRITHITETHIHADFLSGTREMLKELPEATAYLSDMGDADWKYGWAAGNPRVKFLKNGDSIQVGKIEIKAVHTQGHTPEHLSFLVIDHGGGANEPMGYVTGDFVFVGDVGRPDLLETAAGKEGAQEPAARKLYETIVDFEKLPDFIQILPGHGAGSACGKALGAIPSSTVGYEKRFNSAIVTALDKGEEAFVESILSGQPEPPVYFARMKKLNKEGPELLGGLPQPEKISSDDFCRLSDEPDSVILDASGRSPGEFMKAHFPGSLYAPLGDKFSVVTGSYLSPEEKIYLLVSNENEVEEAVRNLIRIGLDQIAGFAVYNEIEGTEAWGKSQVDTPVATTAELQSLIEKHGDSAIVLDVRGAGEFESGHVDGAVNVAHTRLANHLDDLPAKTLLVHCGSGLRASLAIPFLKRNGFEAIYCDGAFADIANQ